MPWRMDTITSDDRLAIYVQDRCHFSLAFLDGRAKIDTCHCALRCRSVKTQSELPSCQMSLNFYLWPAFCLCGFIYHLTIFILTFTCEFWVYMFFKLDWFDNILHWRSIKNAPPYNMFKLICWFQLQYIYLYLKSSN
jgi:hypothetical protein